MAKRKTIFGKILGGITSVAGNAVSAATGIPGLGSLGIGARDEEKETTPVAAQQPIQLNLNPATLEGMANASPAVDSEPSFLKPSEGAVKAGLSGLGWILGGFVVGKALKVI